MRSLDLVAGISGIAFVVLYAGPLALLPPSPTTGPADVAAYYEHNQRVLELVQVLRALAIPAFFLFLAGLISMLRKLEGATGSLTTAAAASGGALTAMALVIVAMRWSITLDAAKLASPPAVQAVRDMAEAVQAFTLFPAASLIGLASWLLMGSRGATKVVGGAGLALVVVLLAGAIAAAFGVPGFNVTLLNAFWFIAVAVIMMVRAARGQEPA